MEKLHFMFNYCTVGGDCRAFLVKDGFIEGNYTADGVMNGISKRAVTAEESEALEALLEKYCVEKWKGGRFFLNFAFAVNPDTFSLEYSFPDGNKGEANSSGGFPKNFAEFLAELTDIFVA